LLLEQQGSTFDAENSYEELLTEKPEWEDAWFRLGYLRLVRSHFPGAVEAFEKCLERRSPWPQAQINLGLAYWRIGDHEAAGKAFEAAIEADAESVDAIRGLAALAIENQDYAKALDFQARLIDRGERSPELFYNTGLLLQKTGQTEDAIKLYREAVADKPDFSEALLNLGHALKEQGHPDEARVYWSQALAANPALAGGYFEGAN
jgi:tetratricopeptide (TPR) repeat protein